MLGNVPLDCFSDNQLNERLFEQAYSTEVLDEPLEGLAAPHRIGNRQPEARSRVYGGIHFTFDNEASQRASPSRSPASRCSWHRTSHGRSRARRCTWRPGRRAGFTRPVGLAICD